MFDDYRRVGTRRDKYWGTQSATSAEVHTAVGQMQSQIQPPVHRHYSMVFILIAPPPTPNEPSPFIVIIPRTTIWWRSAWLDETTSHSHRDWLRQSQLSLLFRVYANNAVDHNGNRPALMSSSVWPLATRELHKITSISWSGGGSHFSQNYRTIIRFSCTTPSLVYSVHRA